MAQALATQRFCTLTHYVQLSEDSVLVLHVHTLPEKEDDTGSVTAGASSVGLPPPFSWLEDKHVQELLVMVHEVVEEKAIQGLTSNTAYKKPVSRTPTTQDLQLKRGRSLRALFSFKPHHVRQHIALPTDSGVSPLFPMMPTFVSAQGRTVYQSSDLVTSGGGFKPFRVVPDSLHVFVDQYQPTSHRGVVKILELLDPGQTPSRNVLTYFQPAQKRGSNSSSEGEGEGEAEGEGGSGGGSVLADPPVEGLKRRRRGGGGGGGGGSRQGRRQGRGKLSSNRDKTGVKKSSTKTRSKGKLTKRRSSASPSLQAELSHQPTIASSLAGVAAGQAPHSHQGKTKLQSPGIDELFGMNSQWLSSDNEEEEEEEGGNETEKHSVNACSSVASIACESSGTSPLSPSSAPTPLAHRPVSEMDGSGTSPVCSWSHTHVEASLFPVSSADRDESKSVWREVEGQCSSSQSPSSRVNLASPGRVGRGREKSTRSLSLKLRNNKHHSHFIESGDPSGSEVFITAESVAEEEDKSDDELPDVVMRATGGPLLVPALSTHGRGKMKLIERGGERERGGYGEVEAEGEEMETPHNGSEISPELWENSASLTSSQPLEDVTNSTPETVDAAAWSGKKAKKCPQTLDDPTGTMDHTGEVSWIVLSSGEEEEEGDDGGGASTEASQPQAPTEQENHGDRKGKKKKRKRKILSPEVLFEGAKGIKDIPPQRVGQWLSQQKRLLLDILQRKVYSHRHNSYITSAKNRVGLQHQMSIHKFAKEQTDLIAHSLVRVFCYKNMNYFSYVMSVLYPECLVRLIMDFHSISFEQAERIMMDFTSDT